MCALNGHYGDVFILSGCQAQRNSVGINLETHFLPLAHVIVYVEEALHASRSDELPFVNSLPVTIK